MPQPRQAGEARTGVKVITPPRSTLTPARSATPSQQRRTNQVPQPRSQVRSIHLAISPGGLVVIDSKQYRGRLQLSPDGLLWHGRHPLSLTLHGVRWEADQADEVLGVADVQVAAIVAVHGAHVPWGRVVASGVTVAPASRVPDLLRALPRTLSAGQVARLADRAGLRFRPAA